MSGWLGCCDCLCPPARALHRSMAAGAARPLPARSGVDNAAYQPDELAAAPCRHCSYSEETQNEASTVITQLPQTNVRDWDRNNDPNGLTTPATYQSDNASSREAPDKLGACSACYAAEMPQPMQNQKPGVCTLDLIPEEATQTDHEPADPAEERNAEGSGSGMANGDSSATNAPGPSTNGQKKSRRFMFRRRSQPAGGHETRRERQWLQRFSRRSHSTGEFSSDLSGAASRVRPEDNTEGGDQTGNRSSRSGRSSLRFGRRRSSRSGSDSRRITEHEEKDGEDEDLEMTAAAAAARKWRRVIKHDFDNDAPLSTHWDFLESVVDDFPRVDVKSYVERKRQPSVSSSSEDEEVPDSQEALLMLRLAESKDIHSDKVERRESLRRGSTTTSRASTSSGSAPISQVNGHPVDSSHIHSNNSPAVQSAPEIRPIMSVFSSWFSPQASSDPERRSSILTQWLSPQPRASSCPPPPAEATHPGSAGPIGDSSPTDQTGSPQGSANGDGRPAHHQRTRRRSIFDRLFPASIGARRYSAPISPSQPSQGPLAAQVRTPTWFQHEHETEAVAPDASPGERHRQRRATVAELSRQNFLQDVEERTQALREEEFGTTDSHDVSTPQQATDSSNQVIPMMDSQRRVQLMLEDAERRLQKEYSRTPSPSLQRSDCSTPDSEEKTSSESPHAGRTSGPSTSSTGAQRRTSLKELKKLNYAISASLQGTTAAAVTSLALVPYQPIIRTLGNFPQQYIVMYVLVDHGDTPDSHTSVGTYPSWSDSEPELESQPPQTEHPSPSAAQSQTSAQSTTRAQDTSHTMKDITQSSEQFNVPNQSQASIITTQHSVATVRSQTPHASDQTAHSKATNSIQQSINEISASICPTQSQGNACKSAQHVRTPSLETNSKDSTLGTEWKLCQSPEVNSEVASHCSTSNSSNNTTGSAPDIPSEISKEPPLEDHTLPPTTCSHRLPKPSSNSSEPRLTQQAANSKSSNTQPSQSVSVTHEQKQGTVNGSMEEVSNPSFGLRSQSSNTKAPASDSATENPALRDKSKKSVVVSSKHVSPAQSQRSKETQIAFSTATSSRCVVTRTVSSVNPPPVPSIPSPPSELIATHFPLASDSWAADERSDSGAPPSQPSTASHTPDGHTFQQPKPNGKTKDSNTDVHSMAYRKQSDQSPASETVTSVPLRSPSDNDAVTRHCSGDSAPSSTADSTAVSGAESDESQTATRLPSENGSAMASTHSRSSDTALDKASAKTSSQGLNSGEHSAKLQRPGTNKMHNTAQESNVSLSHASQVSEVGRTDTSASNTRSQASVTSSQGPDHKPVQSSPIHLSSPPAEISHPGHLSKPPDADRHTDGHMTLASSKRKGERSSSAKSLDQPAEHKYSPSLVHPFPSRNYPVTHSTQSDITTGNTTVRTNSSVSERLKSHSDIKTVSLTSPSSSKDDIVKRNSAEHNTAPDASSSNTHYRAFRESLRRNLLQTKSQTSTSSVLQKRHSGSLAAASSQNKSRESYTSVTSLHSPQHSALLRESSLHTSDSHTNTAQSEQAVPNTKSYLDHTAKNGKSPQYSSQASKASIRKPSGTSKTPKKASEPSQVSTCAPTSSDQLPNTSRNASKISRNSSRALKDTLPSKTSAELSKSSQSAQSHTASASTVSSSPTSDIERHSKTSSRVSQSISNTSTQLNALEKSEAHQPSENSLQSTETAHSSTNQSKIISFVDSSEPQANRSGTSQAATRSEIDKSSKSSAMSLQSHKSSHSTKASNAPKASSHTSHVTKLSQQSTNTSTSVASAQLGDTAQRPEILATSSERRRNAKSIPSSQDQSNTARSSHTSRHNRTPEQPAKPSSTEHSDLSLRASNKSSERIETSRNESSAVLGSPGGSQSTQSTSVSPVLSRKSPRTNSSALSKHTHQLSTHGRVSKVAQNSQSQRIIAENSVGSHSSQLSTVSGDSSTAEAYPHTSSHLSSEAQDGQIETALSDSAPSKTSHTSSHPSSEAQEGQIETALSDSAPSKTSHTSSHLSSEAQEGQIETAISNSATSQTSHTSSHLSSEVQESQIETALSDSAPSKTSHTSSHPSSEAQEGQIETALSDSAPSKTSHTSSHLSSEKQEGQIETALSDSVASQTSHTSSHISSEAQESQIETALSDSVASQTSHTSSHPSSEAQEDHTENVSPDSTSIHSELPHTPTESTASSIRSKHSETGYKKSAAASQAPKTAAPRSSSKANTSSVHEHISSHLPCSHASSTSSGESTCSARGCTVASTGVSAVSPAVRQSKPALSSVSIQTSVPQLCSRSAQTSTGLSAPELSSIAIGPSNENFTSTKAGPSTPTLEYNTGRTSPPPLKSRKCDNFVQTSYIELHEQCTQTSNNYSDGKLNCVPTGCSVSATEADPQATPGPSTSGQHSYPAEASASGSGPPSNAHLESSHTEAEVYQAPQHSGPVHAPTSSSTAPHRHSMLSTGTSTSETHSQSAQTSGGPSAAGVQSQSAQTSVKTSTADAQSQSTKSETDPFTTGTSSQAAQTSTDRPADSAPSKSTQSFPDNTAKNAPKQSAQTTTEASPQRTHPHSTPIDVESISSPNTPPNLSQAVQTSPGPQKTSSAIHPTHPEGSVLLPLPKEPTSSSAQDFGCQTPGPSVGTSTSEHDRTSGLENVADLRQRAGGASWTLAVSAPRGNRSDLGPQCGAGRQLQPPAAAALRLKLEQQQLAAEQRRQQLLQGRSKRAMKLTEGPASGAAAGPSTEGGSEAADKRRREKLERRSKRALELAQTQASSSEEERENDIKKHSSKRRGSGPDAKRRPSSGGRSMNEGVEQRSEATAVEDSKSTRSMAVGTSDHQFPPPPRKTTPRRPKKS